MVFLATLYEKWSYRNSAGATLNFNSGLMPQSTPILSTNEYLLYTSGLCTNDYVLH